MSRYVSCSRPLRAVVLTAAFTLASPVAVAQPPTGFDSPQLDNFIAQKMKQIPTPGLAALAVKDGQVIWSKGYGDADVHQGIPVTADTVFNVASISKSVTATALMQLWEDGEFDLDDDVNDYLPFSVRNPLHPDAPITFRMLLSHTSSISHNLGDNSGLLFTTFGADSPIPLGEHLEDLLTLGGAYATAAVFNTSVPGTQFEYSNFGYALLGYLVEEISGVEFPDYCAANIFGPLEMTSTFWRLSDLFASGAPLASIYIYSHTTQSYFEVGQNATAGYPSTGVRTSANDLAKFLLAHMNGGTLNGATILQPQTVALMHMQHSTAPPGDGWNWGYGFGFEINHSGPQQTQLNIGHSGEWFGAATSMYFRPGSDVGVIVLANSPAALVTSAGPIFVPGHQFAIYSFLPERLLNEAVAHQP